MNTKHHKIKHPHMVKMLWKFIRGDLSANDFESWVYSHKSVEVFLKHDLYMEVISADFSDKYVIYEMKESLSKFLRSSYSNHCRCIEISDDAIIDMGVEGDGFFKHLEEVKRRGMPYWWLSVDKCKDCSAIWLVGADERQNDVYCLSRVDEAVLDKIVNQDTWPQMFETYEEILLRGFNAGKSVSFFDPINDSPLLQTIYDLMEERPSILVTEVAKLLNLDLDTAKFLFEMVERENGGRYKD